MYTERDMNEINARIRRDWMILAPILAILAAAYVYGLAARVQWLSMAAGALLFVAACYGFLARLLPNLRYRGFLRDMYGGLSRQVRGTILEIGDAAEPHDGAMVLPVRLKTEEDGGPARAGAGASIFAHRLAMESGEDDRDERIVYLNASKREMLPGPGAEVTLRCFGRHIRGVETD